MIAGHTVTSVRSIGPSLMASIRPSSAPLVPSTWWRAAILLLTWVSSRTALWWRSALRRPLAVLALLALWRILSLWWASILLLLLAGISPRSALWGATVLLLWWTAVLAGWWTSVALGWTSVLTSWWCAEATWGGVGLLVLGIVAAVDGAEEELHDPKIGSEVDGRVGACHLFLLVLEV